MKRQPPPAKWRGTKRKYVDNNLLRLKDEN